MKKQQQPKKRNKWTEPQNYNKTTVVWIKGSLNGVHVLILKLLPFKKTKTQEYSFWKETWVNVGNRRNGWQKECQSNIMISTAYKSHCEKLDKLGGKGNENLWSSQEQ